MSGKILRPKESWLRSDDPKKFAIAACRCQHPGGFCIQDGHCHYGGDCFKSISKFPSKLDKEIEDIKMRLTKLEKETPNEG